MVKKFCDIVGQKIDCKINKKDCSFKIGEEI